MRLRFTFLVAVILVLLGALPAAAQGNTDSAIEWLRSQIQADGGFSDGFSEGSSLGATTDVLYAAAAAGEDISTWGEEASPLDFLASSASTADTTAALAELILAAEATGQDPTNFGGVNLVEQLQANYNADSGLFEGTVADHAFAMLALNAAGQEVPAEAVQALIALQGEEGGWSFDGTGQADTNTTALALQALAAAGQPVDSEPVQQALTFLREQQNEDGGFPYQKPSDFGTESDANSTAWVIQGLLATDQDLAEWNNPQEFLASLQTEEGAFQWKQEVEGANFLATAQAVPALEQVTFVDLPVVTVSEGPAAATAEASTTAAAPESLPQTGETRSWVELVVAGALLALAGSGVRRFAL